MLYATRRKPVAILPLHARAIRRPADFGWVMPLIIGHFAATHARPRPAPRIFAALFDTDFLFHSRRHAAFTISFVRISRLKDTMSGDAPMRDARPAHGRYAADGGRRRLIRHAARPHRVSTPATSIGAALDYRRPPSRDERDFSRDRRVEACFLMPCTLDTFDARVLNAGAFLSSLYRRRHFAVARPALSARFLGASWRER